MELTQARRRLLMQSSKPNTSPIIVQSGVYWNRSQGGTNNNDDWGITDFYEFDPQPVGRLVLHGYVGADANDITFQYYGENISSGSVYQDWWYFANNDQPGTRGISKIGAKLERISFSIELSKIRNTFVFVEETGQIIFAGKNTPYYGYRNINNMPST